MIYTTYIWFTIHKKERCEQIRQKIRAVLDYTDWGDYYPNMTTDLTCDNNCKITIMMIHHNMGELHKMCDKLRTSIWDILETMEWTIETMPRVYQDTQPYSLVK